MTHPRTLPRWQILVPALIAFAMTCYQLTVGYLGEPVPYVHRPVHLAFILTLFYVTAMARRTEDRFRPAALLFLVPAAIVVAASTYLITHAEPISMRMIYVTPLDAMQFGLGAALILVLFDAACRTIGWPLAVLAGVALLYTYFGPQIPVPFWHQGFTPERAIEQSYLTLNGIWSTPLGVSAGTIFLFVLFGALLLSSGAGEFFTDLANALTGRQVGGPANTAVVSSAFMGMLSGSAAANVVTSGTLTIPTMRGAGFTPSFAAGVEAAASSGGAITPPVMGAAAFIMVEMIGVPYSTVITAAALPAVLYFVACYVSVNLEARRLALRPAPGTEFPTARSVLRRRGYLLLPIVALLYYLVEGYPSQTAAFWAIIYLLCLVVLAAPGALPWAAFAALVPVAAALLWLTEIRDWIDLLSGGLLMAAVARLALDMPVLRHFARVFWEGATDAPRLMIPVTIATAVGGLIIGVIAQTGLGERLSMIVLEMGGGSLFLTLLYTLVAGLVLGMGMPIAGAYVVLAALLAPALTQMLVPIYAEAFGLDPQAARMLAMLAAHLSLIYAASWANLTPPVAIAVYAAAAIAEDRPGRTTLAALKIGFPIFIMPFVIVYQPQILAQLGLIHALFPLATAVLGILAISAGAIGWLRAPLPVVLRGLLIVAGFLLVGASTTASLAGFGLILAIGVWLACRSGPARATARS